MAENKLTYYHFATYGNIWDLGWLSFYDFFDRIGIDLGDKTNFYKFKDLIQTGVYDMIQLDKYCIVCSYPKTINRDERNNLHSVSESAIEWKDGYKLWYLHGVAFEYELWDKIVTKKLPPKEVLGLENIEQRRSAIKIYGIESLFESLDAKLIDKSQKYELYCVEKMFRNFPKAYYLKYKDPSTSRVYISGIPPEIGVKGDSILAMAWKFHLDKDYKKGGLFDYES